MDYSELYKKLSDGIQQESETEENSVWDSYAAKADLYFENRDYKKAFVCLEKLYFDFRDEPISKEMCFVKLLFDLGVVDELLGDSMHAWGYFGSAVHGLEKLIGLYHLETAKSYEFEADYLENNMPWTAMGADLVAESDILKLYLKVLDIKVHLLGENHIDTASVYYKIGNCRFNNEEYERCFEDMEKAYKIYSDILGSDAPETIEIVNRIQSCKKFVETKSWK